MRVIEMDNFFCLLWIIVLHYGLQLSLEKEGDLEVPAGQLRFTLKPLM